MKRSLPILLRLLLSALFAVACGYLLGSALDMPMQTLDENTLVTLYATEAPASSGGNRPFSSDAGDRGSMRPTCWPPLFAWIWFRHAIVSEPTVDIRYDELAQSAMLLHRLADSPIVRSLLHGTPADTAVSVRNP